MDYQTIEPAARVLVWGVGAYLGLGVLFAAAFVSRLLARYDPAIIGSPVLFRFLIFPGAAALWPVLLAQCLRRRGIGAKG